MIVRRATIITLLGISLVAGIITGANTPSTLAAATPEEIARQELPQWLSDVRNQYKDFGFKDASELNMATLGKPFQLYVLNPQRLQQYQLGQRLIDLVEQQQVWEFPILVRGEARSILTVANFGGQWQVVELGGSGLSEKLMALQQKLAQTSDEVKLVRFYQTYSTFALVEAGDKETLIHVGTPDGLLDNLDSEHLTPYTPEQVLPKLKLAFAEVQKADAEVQKADEDARKQSLSER